MGLLHGSFPEDPPRLPTPSVVGAFCLGRKHMSSYYNEFDPYAAQWLRNLIAAGAIAPGEVDERHLWPAFHHLIEQCGPAVVFGEQVASKAADAWIDLVQTDMEALGYAFGAVAFPSAGVGAPHIRDRTFWLGHANGARLEGHAGHGGAEGRQGPGGSVAKAGVLDRLGDGWQEVRYTAECDPDGDGWCQLRDIDPCECDCIGPTQDGAEYQEVDGVLYGRLSDDPGADESDEQRPGPVNGFWRDADWLFCRDGKWRPVEPGTQPLGDGAAARVGRSGTDWRASAGPEGFGHRAGRLKGYGNAINAAAAEQFIRASGL